MTILHLPIPPSTNACYANNKSGKGRARYRTKRYTTWANAAGWDIKEQRPDKVAGHFACIITLDATKRRNSDLDNRLKPLLDLLETHQIIDNDCLCDMLQVKWGYAPKGCEVLIYKSDSNEARMV